MSRRDQITMTEEKVAVFLRAGSKVQMATVGKDGGPHLVTMFYTLLEATIAFSTYTSSQKVVNLRRNPAMTCLLESGDEYDRPRGVALYGRGRIVEDPAVRLRVGMEVGARLTGSPSPRSGMRLDPAFRAAIDRSMAKRVVVVMEPDRITSWDHRKL